MTTNLFGVNEPEEYKPWTLADIYADLGSKKDVARALDVSDSRVQAWISRRERVKSPLPVTRLGNIDTYSIQEWKDWFANWLKGRKPGTKWTTEASVHGKGRNFFTYERPHRREPTPAERELVDDDDSD